MEILLIEELPAGKVWDSSPGVRGPLQRAMVLGGRCTLSRAGSPGNGICHQFLTVFKKGEEEFVLG